MPHLTGLKVGSKADTIAEVVFNRARLTPDRRAFSFLDGDAQLDLTYAELERYARSFALELSAQTRPGERVLLLYPPGPAYVIAIFACAFAGVIAVPLYPPPAHRTLARMQAIVADAGATLALTDPALLQRLATQSASLDGLRLSTIEPFGTSSGILRPGPRADDTAIVQYTSGSTGAPKGVIVTHQNILSNAATIAEAFGLTSDDVGVSWLPPYHDMGLIGATITPVATGFPVVIMTPLAFLRRPLRWLQAISRFGGTVSGAPNFAYALCAQKLTPERAADLDLSSWRVAFAGAEPVRAATVDQFTRAAAACGFPAASFRPCYGLAEATLIVSGVQTRERPVSVTLDAGALAAGRAVPVDKDSGATIVGCGGPPSGLAVLIVDPVTCDRLPDRSVGEIWVSSPSNARGYWGRTDANTTFGATLSDGGGPYLRTGDMGFILEGELFITGRRKEVIIVNGRNLYPRDIEEIACNAHAALNPDESVAFSVTADDGEAVVFAAELRSTDLELRGDAAAAVRLAVLGELDVALRDVCFVRPGAIPRTSSGKIRRLAMRADYLAKTLDLR